VLGNIDPQSRPRKKFRSRPVIGRDPENFSGRDRNIFQKIYQDIPLDESNLKIFDRVATDIRIATQKFQSGRPMPVATVFGSRSDSFFGSRPILGHDPEKNLGRDLVETVSIFSKNRLP
jgi:hypothetical protein